MTKIMLVEDDKSLREIYSIRLVAEGYDIVSASDGEEALAMAVRERPDLIISDVMMPKISGFDMWDILRTTPETKSIKIIMMTALSSEDQRQRGESLGADLYLVKSQVGIEDVVASVHKSLGDKPATANAIGSINAVASLPTSKAAVPVPVNSVVAPPVSNIAPTVPVAATVPVVAPVVSAPAASPVPVPVAALGGQGNPVVATPASASPVPVPTVAPVAQPVAGVTAVPVQPVVAQPAKPAVSIPVTSVPTAASAVSPVPTVASAPIPARRFVSLFAPMNIGYVFTVFVGTPLSRMICPFISHGAI